MLYSMFLKIESIKKRARAFWFRVLTKKKFRFIGSHTKLRGQKFFELGKEVIVGDFCWIEAVPEYRDKIYNPRIQIGDNVAMSDFVHISAVDSIIIGEGTLIGSKVYIGDHSHGHYRDYNLWCNEKNIRPKDRELADIKPIRIGRNCWIGDGAVILAGTIIGDNCIVGANSVVRGTFKNNILIAGLPAKIVKEYK